MLRIREGLSSLLLLLAIGWLSGCAIHNPNPGENEADALNEKKKYDEALRIIEPAAEHGYPWAMLRLGIAWEYGRGKPQNPAKALSWYKKAAVAIEDSAWADGLVLLSGGDKGFFNRNNDAKVAQYLAARLYSQGGPGIEQNLPEAWLWAQYVHRKAEGSDLLFCCENTRTGAQHIELMRVEDLLRKIEAALPADELESLKHISGNWRPY